MRTARLIPTIAAVGLAVGGTSAVGVDPAGAALPSNCTQTNLISPVVCTYSYTGTSQSFVVPGGVTSVDVVAIGAHGGQGYAAAGGAAGGPGASVEGDAVPVTPNDSLTVFVGGVGGDGGEFDSGTGGTPGGGGPGGPTTTTQPGAFDSGGGGGYSGVFNGSTPLVIAGGGGGGGGYAGGPGGAGDTGSGGGNGGDGTDNAFGFGFGDGADGGKGAVGATGGDGGAGSTGGTSGSGGSPLQGGTGGGPSSGNPATGRQNVAGAGGGGGYAGGGGGGSGASAGGGGGGSSYGVTPLTNQTTTDDPASVTISYLPQPRPSGLGTTTTITGVAPEPSLTGHAATVSYSVTSQVDNVGASPTGLVTVSSDDGASCSGTATAGSCDITFSTPGTKTLTATYTSDTELFAGSSSDPYDHGVDADHAPTIMIRSGSCSTSLTSATLTFAVNDADGDATTLSITGNTNPAATANPTITGSGPTYTLSLGAGAPGARTLLTLTASDGTASTDRKFAVVNGIAKPATITTTATNSIVFARTGAKKITTGGTLGDVVCGSSGNDTITTGPGYDYVFAGPGNDTVKLGAGNDRVTGGTGADTVDGGTGTDAFTDYSAAQKDKKTNVP